MTTIPVDLTVENIQMYLGTIIAVVREEYGRVPDFQNASDSVAAVLMVMALQGKTVDDMRAYLRAQPEWHAPKPKPEPRPKPEPKPKLETKPKPGAKPRPEPKLKPLPAGAGPEIHGRLRSNGPRLFDDAGPWKWKMATAFDALRLLVTGGEAQLRQYLAWVISIKGNGIRVFGNWKVTGLDFRQVPDYMGWLRKLCVLTRALGLRVEFCAVCDYIPEGLAAQQQFIDAVAAVLAEFDHAVLTFGNEPYQNMENPEKITPPNAPGLLMARGMCNPNDPSALPYLPSAGFTVYQTVRSDDWMRKVGKDGFEIRNGFSDAFRGTKDACINTEMIGAAETYQPGRRSNRPDEFFMAGVAAAMFNSGATAHGDSLTMQQCVVPGPIEAKCAAELFRGIDIVPIDAPTWNYARYGPAHPPFPMPVEPDPIDGEGDDVRMHAVIGPTQAVSINYRYTLPGHDAWKPKGINGWRTVLQDGPYVLSEPA
jgi:hypothetical protein